MSASGTQGRSIQLFVPVYDVEGCLSEIRACLECGWTGLGFKTIEFENAWKAYTGLPYAHFLNSSTSGLQLALKTFKEARGWSDGDEVISTPLTFVSTNHAILYENLVPVFADIDDSLCLDPASVEAAITPRTRAVMYVGMGGNAGQLTAIKELCHRRGLVLVLDAAHMAGTLHEGRHAGHDVDCTVFSFQAVKNLPTADSGMICFADPQLDARVRKLSWLGIDKDTYARSGEGGRGHYKWMYDIDAVGLKAHGNSVMAAIGLVQLRRLEADNVRRRELSARYDEFLGKLPGLAFPRIASDCVSSRHLYQVRVLDDRREDLMEHLNADGIFPGVHYRINTAYPMYHRPEGTLPRAEAASRELLSLPLHLALSDGDLERVAASVAAFLAAPPRSR